MSANPNPALITDAMWRLWEEAAAIIPGVRLGGIVNTSESGYHNTVNNNLNYYPGTYSVRCAADLTDPKDKSRALDLTMDDNQMMLRTGYLEAAAVAGDPRMRVLRSFIGTTDCDNVTCYIHDSESQAFRWDGGRDDSHLWHVHLSVFTRYCATWDGALDGVLSVLAGGDIPTPTPPTPGGAPPFPFPTSHYLGQPDPDPCCHSGYYSDTDAQAVRTWQAQMSTRGWSIGVDGMYGPGSESVCRSFQAEKGLTADGLCGPTTWATSWEAPVT